MSSEGTPRSRVVTTITSLIARSGHERQLETDYRDAFNKVGVHSHHVNSLLLHQESGLSFLISSFRDEAALNAWRASSTHQEMIECFESHSVRELETIKAPVSIVHVPSNESAPKWKVFLSTWAALYVFSLVETSILDRIGFHPPMPIRVLATTFLSSLFFVYLITPLILKYTRIWRLGKTRSEVIPVVE